MLNVLARYYLLILASFLLLKKIIKFPIRNILERIVQIKKYRLFFLVIFICSFADFLFSKNLKVITWNIWGRLNLEKRYFFENKSARSRTIEIVKDSGADIIAMIETYGSAKEISEKLEFYYYTPSKNANLSIFSRYRIKKFGTLQNLSSFSFIQATIFLADKKEVSSSVQVYCIWLTSGGRNIVAIKNKKISDTEFVKEDNNRYQMMKKFLKHKSVKKSIRLSDKIPVIITGDFNCVSSVDFNEDTKKIGLNFGRALEQTPTHDLTTRLGFIDTYRFTNPQITKETLGYTWTTVGKGYDYNPKKDFVPVENMSDERTKYRGKYARINFYLFIGKKIKTNKIKSN